MIRARGMAALAGLLAALAGPMPVSAHETLPASLQLEESSPHTFSVSWRLPATQGAAPDIDPVLPANCRTLSERQAHAVAGAKTERWQVFCDGGIAGKTLRFDGQPAYLIDAVVRIHTLDGGTLTRIARPRDNEIAIDKLTPQARDERGFFRLGIEHILGGIDHLLFIFCLLLWIRSWRPLLVSITGFTLAHSITLGLASLGVLHIPGPPVEASIALSIVFLAAELRRAQQAGAAPVPASRPWLLAFSFGLLHGLGFAGALKEIGLPEDGLAAALLQFNLGVEAGQLLFVAAVLALLALARRTLAMLALRPAAGLQALPAYGVGALAAFWFFQRLASAWGNHVV